MLLLPADIVALLVPFAPHLASHPSPRRRGDPHPGRRTISSALRAVSVAHLPTFQAYFRVLNRAAWSSLGPCGFLFRIVLC